MAVLASAAVATGLCIAAHYISKTIVACGDVADDIDRLDRENRFRSDVFAIVATEMPCVDGSSVKAAVRDITCTEGYDICGVLEDLARTPPGNVDNAWWQTHGVTNTDIVQYANAQRIAGQPRPIPRFVAAVVVELRASRGVMQRTPANVLLIQDKYLRLCKLHRVRQADIVRHRQLVVNLYFSEYFDFDIGHARRRAPYWLRWLRGEITQFVDQPSAY